MNILYCSLVVGCSLVVNCSFAVEDCMVAVSYFVVV